MLHKFFEEGDWFAPKRLGYGAGLPIAWQGWVLLLGYVLLMLGITLSFEHANEAGRIVAVFGMILATVLFAIIAKRRTKGGWHWRR